MRPQDDSYDSCLCVWLSVVFLLCVQVSETRSLDIFVIIYYF